MTILRNNVSNILDSGLILTEAKRQSAVMKLSNVIELDGNGRSPYVIEDSEGGIAAENAKKNDTGDGVKKLDLIPAALYRLFSVSEQALDTADQSWFDTMLSQTASILSTTLDKAVLGTSKDNVPAESFDSFKELTTSTTVANSGDIYKAIIEVGKNSNAAADGLLLTNVSYNSLRAMVNSMGTPLFDWGTITLADGTVVSSVNGIHYEVANDNSDVAILGPFGTRAVVGIGEIRDAINPYGENYFNTNTVGVRSEMWASFRVSDTKDFVKLVRPAEETENPVEG